MSTKQVELKGSRNRLPTIILVGAVLFCVAVVVLARLWARPPTQEDGSEEAMAGAEERPVAASTSQVPPGTLATARPVQTTQTAQQALPPHAQDYGLGPGYKPANMVHVPPPPPDRPLSPVSEPLDPLTYQPPMHSAGGVNGTRPPRPVPGIPGPSR